MKLILTTFDEPNETVFIGSDLQELVYTFIDSYKNGKECVGNRILRNDEIENILKSLLMDREIPYLTGEDLIHAISKKISIHLYKNDSPKHQEEYIFV